MAKRALRRVKGLHRATKIGARAALLIGVSRSVDLFVDRAESFKYAGKEARTNADSAALASDWQELGADFDDAVAKVNGR